MRERGFDPAPLLACCGIAPALLTALQARVSAPSYAALWLEITGLLDDGFFGEDNRHMKAGSFAMLFRAVHDAADLEQALRRALRFFAVLLDDLRPELRVEGADAFLTLHAAARREPGAFANETLLILFVGLMN